MVTAGRRAVFAACLALALGSAVALAAQKPDKDSKTPDKRPRFTLKAQPSLSIAPTRIVLTAELNGGPNDFEEFYCPTVRWEWADGTSSEATNDCTPYEPGASEIKRLYVVEHRFERPGAYKVFVRLKQRDKEVAAASALIQVRPGVSDITP